MPKKKINAIVGQIPLRHTGQSLYMLGGGGGTFQEGTIKGLFGPTVNGCVAVVYVNGESYELDIQEAVKAAIADYKQRTLGKLGKLKIKEAP